MAKLTASQKKVEILKARVAGLWVAQCMYDNIPTDSKFVVFSADNPYQARYSEAVIALQEALKAEKRNAARRARHEAYTSCGLKRVKGALGGVYYE